MVLREGGQNRVKLDHLDMSISVHVEPVKGPRHRPMFQELAQTYCTKRHWLYFRVERLRNPTYRRLSDISSERRAHLVLAATATRASTE